MTAPGILICAAIAQGSEGRKSPVGPRGEAPVGGLGTSWSSLQALFTNFDYRHDKNSKMFHD